MTTLTRHDFLATGLAATAISPLGHLFAAEPKPCFQIGVCDWSIGRMADPSALEFAKQIGLDGLGTLANDMHLCRLEVQQEYKDAAKKFGVEALSLAIGELNNERMPEQRNDEGAR